MTYKLAPHVTDEMLKEIKEFNYWEELDAYVRACEYFADGILHEDIFVVNVNNKEINVDIPKYNTKEIYEIVAKDLIDKGMVIEC